MTSLTRLLAAALALGPLLARADDAPFSGLNTDLGNLYRTSPAQTRSLSAENPTGEPGKGGRATTGTGQNAARELGQTWKVSPSVNIRAG